MKSYEYIYISFKHFNEWSFEVTLFEIFKYNLFLIPNSNTFLAFELSTLTVYYYFRFGLIGIAHARILTSIRNLGVFDDELPLSAILFDLYPARIISN